MGHKIDSEIVQGILSCYSSGLAVDQLLWLALEQYAFFVSIQLLDWPEISQGWSAQGFGSGTVT